MHDRFSEYHPIVNFVYFAIILSFIMIFLNPICILISLISGVIYYKKMPFWLNIIIVCTALINPLFSHEGSTILAYLPSKNPLTLESIIYGLVSGVLMANMILWFMCYSKVMTSDKFIFLFGKIFPSLSLVLSMVLRFIPKFKYQLEIVNQANFFKKDANFMQKIKNKADILSIMITWSLENAIETSDSMKSRGYGITKRTAFSVFIFNKRDENMLIWILFLGIFTFLGFISKVFLFNFYPIIDKISVNFIDFFFYFAYFLLNFTPILINRLEERRWKNI